MFHWNAVRVDLCVMFFVTWARVGLDIMGSQIREEELKAESLRLIVWVAMMVGRKSVWRASEAPLQLINTGETHLNKEIYGANTSAAARSSKRIILEYSVI